MYILGLSSYAHEASASLLKDGEVRCIFEEERFNREKHTWKYPQHAIAQCLQFEGISIHDVQHITFFWKPTAEIVGNLRHVLRYFPRSLNLLRAPSGGNELTFGVRITAMRNVGRELQRQFSLATPPKVHFIEHHLAHAASCFFVSPFEDAAIFTVDGRGESTTTLLAEGRQNTITRLAEIKVPHSLGHLYAAITAYLGFSPFFDEWKVMGMSAYGEATCTDIFDDIVQLRDDGGFRLNLKYFNFHTHGQLNWVSQHLIDKLGPPRSPQGPYDQSHFDVAFGLQRAVEKAGVHLTKHLFELTRSPNLCMTGGVILNCLMNRKIMEETSFQNFFIQPIANDAGTSLGSALYFHHQVLDRSRTFHFDSAYLGAEYDDREIEKALQARRLEFRKSDNIARDTAALIAEGKIVGWFQGRMEAGPRALGNRSIVVDPRDPTMKDRLNSRVKKREFFRPFAPSVLEEKTFEYFEMPKDQLSPYMILTGDVREGKRKIIPAVTHADGSARVQTVGKRTNARYWQLIREFERVTGVPVVLNTSFNENEPIVATPDDAVNCFLRTSFDALAIGDYLVTKQAAEIAS